MSFDPLPKDLEQGVLQYAKEHHVSHDEAVLILIESGLGYAHRTSSEDSANYSGATSAGTSDGDPKRYRHLKRGPQPPLRTDDPEAMIGMFASSPEIVDNILKVVESRYDHH